MHLSLRQLAAILGTFAFLGFNWSQASQDAVPDKPKENWTVVELLTNGEIVIAVMHEARDTAGKNPLNLQLDKFTDAADLAEELLASRKKAYGDKHWRVTDARQMATQ